MALIRAQRAQDGVLVGLVSSAAGNNLRVNLQTCVSSGIYLPIFNREPPQV